MSKLIVTALVLMLSATTFAIDFEKIDVSGAKDIWYDVVDGEYLVSGFSVNNSEFSFTVYAMDGTSLTTITTPTSYSVAHYAPIEFDSILNIYPSQYFYDSDPGYEFRALAITEKGSLREILCDDDGTLIFTSITAGAMREIYTPTGTYLLMEKELYQFRSDIGTTAFAPTQNPLKSKVALSYSQGANEIDVSRNEPGDMTLKLYDLRGRVVFEKDLSPLVSKITLPQIGSGVYVASIVGKKISPTHLKLNKKR
jgi:hypothetical protein